MNTKLTGVAILATLITEFAGKHESSHSHTHNEFEQPLSISCIQGISVYGIVNSQQHQSLVQNFI